jgi:glycosyltransferase involved in cell wall biosynthesis
MRAARRVPRVVFVNRYYYPDESATAQLLTDLASGLVERGFSVQVVCSRQLYGVPQAQLPRREIVRGVEVHRVWTTRFGRRGLAGRALDYASFYVTCGVRLLALLRAGDLVVAKTDPPLVSLVAAVAARFRGAQLVNWLQDIFPEVASKLGANPLPAPLDRMLRAWRNRSLRFAAMNVVLGSRMRDFIGEQEPKARCRIIENWADTRELLPKPSGESALRQREGLAGKFVVGYSGNLGRAHEYETLLAAAENLRSQSDIIFLIVGGGFNMEALRAEVARRQLTNFRFLPYQPRADLGDSLAAADIHWASLIPSMEGIIVPSKFYGILAVGRPVLFVGDPDGELARIIRESSCGLAVTIGDAEGLVAAISRLKADGALRMAMGEAARALLIQRFNRRLAIESWVELLLEPRAQESGGGRQSP